jgi:restriction system protein
MKKADLLKSTRRGFFQITQQGKELLSANPSKININLLQQYPQFQEFQNLRGTRSGTPVIQNDTGLQISGETPSEALENAYENLRTELAGELLGKLKNVDPIHFESIVVELLVKMGYCGSRIDAGKDIGKTGDGGIDGIIKEDKLCLDAVYIQAKRWDTNPVGRPDVMQFAGALQAKHGDVPLSVKSDGWLVDG